MILTRQSKILKVCVVFWSLDGITSWFITVMMGTLIFNLYILLLGIHWRISFLIDFFQNHILLFPCPCAVFQVLCHVLNSLDQGLVCSSNCNVETMREASFRCFYVLLPSEKGMMLLRVTFYPCFFVINFFFSFPPFLNEGTYYPISLNMDSSLQYWPSIWTIFLIMKYFFFPDSLQIYSHILHAWIGYSFHLH